MNVPRVEPKTAEHLMRSRFEAFQSGDVEWLLRTWHPDTRPPRLDLGDIRWRGLQIVDVVAGGPDDTRGTVEFRATYLTDDGLGILHERSRFVRADGRWFYVDGEVTAS